MSQTITLQKSIWVAGVLQASGATITVDDALAGALVHAGSAVYVTDPMSGSRTVPAMFGTDASGNITGLVGPDGLPITSTPALRFCIPGRNTATSFSDLSDNTATMTVDAGNTGPFGTADYCATVAAANGGLTIANAKLNWNPASQSLIHSFVLKRAAPVGNESIVGVSGGVGAGQTGYYVSHRATTGKLKIVPTVAGVIVNAQNDSTLAYSDGTPQNRHCTIAYDATTGIWYMWRDGVLSDAWTGSPMTGANAYPNAVVGNEYRVGGTAGGATVTTVVTLTYGHQLYVVNGSLPAHIGRIAALLAESPRVPLNFVELSA